MGLAFAILGLSVVTLAGLRIWNPKDIYHIYYPESVIGLQKGASVSLNGVRVGKVKRVFFDLGSTDYVVVTIALNPGTPVRKNAKAVITSIGITGNTFIELVEGSEKAPPIRPNRGDSIIAKGPPVSRFFLDILKEQSPKMERALDRLLDATSDDKRKTVIAGLDRLRRKAIMLVQQTKHSPQKIRRVLRNIYRTTKLVDETSKQWVGQPDSKTARIGSFLKKVLTGARKFARKVRGLDFQPLLDEVKASVSGYSAKVEDPQLTRTLVKLAKSTERMSRLAKGLSVDFYKKDHELGQAVSKLEKATDKLKALTGKIRQQPDYILKGQSKAVRALPK
jgi:hypothetical protein